MANGIANQIIKGALSQGLKLYTPNPEGDPINWIKDFKLIEDGKKVKLEIEADWIQFQVWLALNLRVAAEGFVDLQDGQDLFELDKYPTKEQGDEPE